MAQFYHHEPLGSPDSIRLLDLLPARTWDAPVKCRIRQVTFEQARNKYEALSYVWGASVGSRPITCNGGELLITPNCHDAILHLRRRLLVRTLWIDSICIDQRATPDSTQERNNQVKKMGLLYQSASRVVIWLGSNPAGPIHLRAKDYWLFKLGMCVGVHKESCPSTTLWWANFDWITKSKQNCFLPIVDSSWFKRMWTVQNPGKTIYKSFNKVMDTLLYTLCFRLDIKGSFSLWYDLLLYPSRARLSAAQTQTRTEPRSLPESADPSEHLNVIIAYMDKKEAYSQVVQLQANVWANWAFLVTKTGYLGRAYRTCQEGDQLWLLAGSLNPVILRQTGSEYRYIAPASFYGMMKGELWPKNEEELKIIYLI